MKENAKPNEILKLNLKGLGFEEIKPRLYALVISEEITLYRDYRTTKPTIYAYNKNLKINPYQFLEARTIEKVEKNLETKKLVQNNLLAFT